MKFATIAASAAIVGLTFPVLAGEEQDGWGCRDRCCRGQGVELTICRSVTLAKPDECNTIATLPTIEACETAGAQWRAGKFAGPFRAFCTDADGNVEQLFP